MIVTPPRWLYLHGFASSPTSTKATQLAAHYAQKGIALTALDLRQPSFEHQRLSAMIAHVRVAIGGERDRAVLFGSSLGGLTAARVAEEDARVCAIVLLAPAFRMIERWRLKLGEEAWARWEKSGSMEVNDHAANRKARVDFGFPEDASRVDARSDGWPDVRVPTLIVHGVRDDVVDIELSRVWARGKRHARLVEVDDGHELRASLATIALEADIHLSAMLGGAGG